MEEAGIPDPAAVASSYCWQLSGGLAQRAAIAAAMILEPSLLVADEPTTALDVTTQAALVRFLVELTGRRGMALLFITHDLSLARLLPQPGEDLSGCPFAPRCPRAGTSCRRMPEPKVVDGRVVVCHHPMGAGS